MNDSPLKPASSRRKKMDKTMMAIYFLILFIVAGAALLAFLCLSKPSDKKNKAGSDPSIASSSTLKNSHQTGTDAKSTAKTKIKEEKPVDPYENLAVANVDDALNLREKPDTDAKVLGTCFRGGGGTILKRKNGWTKIRSGGLEGWLKDDYLVFGDDIKPLAKELGLYIATVSTQTLHVREEASTDSAIVGLAAAEDYYPVLSQETGWVKIQLSVDTSGYVSSDYVTISVKPGRAISIEAEMAALEAARQAAEEAEQASRAAEEARIAAASMTACSSQPSETTTAETTAAGSTQENDTSAESSDASETTTAGEKETAQTTDADHAEDETLSEKEITELYRGFARSLQSIIANKNMNDLAELLVYPSYIGIDDGIVVNNRTEFMALDADKVFTDALIEAVKTADVSSTELTKAGFIVGDPSGKPAVTFGLDKEGSIGITAINY